MPKSRSLRHGDQAHDELSAPRKKIYHLTFVICTGEGALVALLSVCAPFAAHPSQSCCGHARRHRRSPRFLRCLQIMHRNTCAREMRSRRRSVAMRRPSVIHIIA